MVGVSTTVSLEILVSRFLVFLDANGFDWTNFYRCSSAALYRCSRRCLPGLLIREQVLLVQLTERSLAAGSGGASQHAPSARCLRHLVAISKGGPGDTEAIYSFSEVRGFASIAVLGCILYVFFWEFDVRQGPDGQGQSWIWRSP